MRKLLSQLPATLGYLLAASPVLAQGAGGGVPRGGGRNSDVVGTITGPATIAQDPGDTGRFLSVLFTFITVVAGIYALWQFLSGGLGFISSNGDKAKVQESTQKIMMAILGLTVIGASFIIVSVVGRLLFGAGFNVLSPQLQTVN